MVHRSDAQGVRLEGKHSARCTVLANKQVTWRERLHAHAGAGLAWPLSAWHHKQQEGNTLLP